MLVRNLSGKWNLRQCETDNWIEAVVPGTVHLDLMQAGIIPDPFVGENENRVQWVAEQDWHYRRIFSVDETLIQEETIELVCEGLDTLAEITINGSRLAHTDNMFRQYRWDIKPYLMVGENEINIVFHSPTSYVKHKMAERPLICVGDWMKGWPYIRKTASHFGWDWGPKLPTSGIWKDIRLEAWSAARLKDVFIRQHHYSGKVTLAFMIQSDLHGTQNAAAVIKILTPDGKTLESRSVLNSNRAEIMAVYIDNPRLWWPNGYGKQPLYQAEVSLLVDDQVADCRNFQIGLRTVELSQVEDPWGTSFTFVVNGSPIFCKGSNWIPTDSLPSRLSADKLEFLIRSAALSHQNMLRVWGGGYYENETFYELCDRYGILVWQDFMFSCAVYPLDDDLFLENLREEVSQVVRRLRHHACLALWCGNNEMETGWVDWGWSRQPSVDGLKKSHQRFFNQILPAWVSDEDPERSYWPGSPFSKEPFVEPNGDSCGDVHQWQVWHELKPFRFYREHTPRFVSEFGFQSLPALKTIAGFADPPDWNLTSYIMEQHQKNASGNGKIITYLAENFRFPKDFRSMVYLSQIQQGEALRIGVEFWRRSRERTSGTLYWQLNDCWPVASWSSIDYAGRWKAAHYMACRFYHPLLVSVADVDTRMEIFITNDYLEIQTGLIRWSLMTLDGEVLSSDEHVFLAMPSATTLLEILDFSNRINAGNRRNVVMLAELYQDDLLLSSQVIPLVPDKYLLLKNPHIRVDVSVKGQEMVLALSADSLARFIELSIEGLDVIFSDNYFDLPPRKVYQVKFPLPEGWSVEKVRQNLKVVSLFDSFA